MLRRLRLPAPFLDPEDLRTRFTPFLRPLQQSGTDDDLVAYDMRVVVGVGGAVGVVETIDRVAWEKHVSMWRSLVEKERRNMQEARRIPESPL